MGFEPTTLGPLSPNALMVGSCYCWHQSAPAPNEGRGAHRTLTVSDGLSIAENPNPRLHSGVGSNTGITGLGMGNTVNGVVGWVVADAGDGSGAEGGLDGGDAIVVEGVIDAGTGELVPRTGLHGWVSLLDVLHQQVHAEVSTETSSDRSDEPICWEVGDQEAPDGNVGGVDDEPENEDFVYLVHKPHPAP